MKTLYEMHERLIDLADKFGEIVTKPDPDAGAWNALIEAKERAEAQVEQIRSIMTEANIKAGQNHDPATTAAFAWRTIGAINKVLNK